MAQITICVYRDDVYEEVAKATDYTGSKLMEGDASVRDRILAGDEDLADLGRFWEEAVAAANEHFKELLISGATTNILATQTQAGLQKAVSAEGMEVSELSRRGYRAVLEVSVAFDTALTKSVESAMRSYFIASIIGQWFKFANKGEAGDYFGQAAEYIEAAERMLYSRRKPKRPE